MQSLFDDLLNEQFASYTPSEPPQIASRGIKDIQLNVETTGLQWWAGDKIVGAAVRLPDGTTSYLPCRHRGNNIDEGVMTRWAQRELRDLHITNINTRFEVHNLWNWGVDLEAQNCTVSDVAHYAALLDDHRQRFALDALIVDYLGDVRVPRLDESRMDSYYAVEAAPRAMYNVQAVAELREKMWPLLDEQDLQRVRSLEDKVIYPVCEMERNGAPIDVELLDRWIVESDQKFKETVQKLTKMVGFQVDPLRPEHRRRLWDHLGLPFEYLPSGRESFTDEIVKAHAKEHPAVGLLRYASKLSSLRSKYLLKYRKTVDSNGILRYALHQLRAQKDPHSDFESAGTVTGRFSSSEICRKPSVGINIQQEMKVAKQRVAFGYDEDDDSHDDEIFIIRKLRIPPKGRLWLSADAMQEEYRIFVSYIKNPALLKAYEGDLERLKRWEAKGKPPKDPDEPMSFHRYMYDKIVPFMEGRVWTYRQQKDLNFAYIYGAGLVKQALMLGHLSKSEYEEIQRKRAYDDPRLDATKLVRRIYNQELPEVKGLLEKAGHIAKPACDADCYEKGTTRYKNQWLHEHYPHQGFVRTILGRRSRFPEGQRLHKAFNSIDQGSGGDIIKQKLVELHAERKATGFTMRYPVHDEVDGDVPDTESARLVGEVLNRQSFPMLKVPILWDVSTGANWAEC